MRKLVILLLMAFSIKAVAQNNDYIVTMTGMGDLKMNMTIAALEKVLNKKITLKNLLNKEGGYADTIKTKYKNIDVQLYLEDQYIDEKKSEIQLKGIKTSSPLCKTKSGIGIGDDKLKIINAYEDYPVNIYPSYEDDSYTKRSKTKSTITVSNDENSNVITFFLNNKKVIAIELAYNEGD